MKINNLIKTDLEVEVSGIKTNSKDIQKGDVFVCALGNYNKKKYVDDAIKKGAKIIVGSGNIKKRIPWVSVSNPNLTLKKMLDRFYHYPFFDTNLIGITGTDGKTTVASILHDMLDGASIGTNGFSCSGYHEDLKNTTPSLDKVYYCVNKARELGVRNVLMEVSSESYLTNRIPYLKFERAIFTNITDEHLDKHLNFENYFECKMQLIKNSNLVIVNRDSPYFKKIIQYNCNYLTYGKKKSTLRIKKCHLYNDKTLIKFSYKGKKYNIVSPLVGKFNVYNLMASILCLLSLNYEMNDILERIKKIKQVSGRMEFLKCAKKKIIIDYAHTINATKTVLKFIRKHHTGRIITVVGCAGGRYKEKRKWIGKYVLKYSDLAILTSDDPREEEPLEIIHDMLLKTKKKNYYCIISRSEAIKLALQIADSLDLVVILGKGRDNYMAINDKYLEYSDIDVINKYLS